MCLSLDMPNKAWDIVPQYTINDMTIDIQLKNIIWNHSVVTWSHIKNITLLKTLPAKAYSMSAK